MNPSEDITDTLQAKSDQMNACDLVAGPITITIERVEKVNSKEQPWHVYTGEGRQPYKPCLTMRRMIAAFWGVNKSEYVGRSMTLYCDMEVTYGKQKGGIRISHMSHLDGKKSISLRVSQAATKIFTVKNIFTVKPITEIQKTSFITREQSKELWTIAQSAGMSAASYGAWMQDEFKIKSSAEIKTDEFEHIKKEIQQMIKVDVPESSFGNIPDEKAEKINEHRS